MLGYRSWRVADDRLTSPFVTSFVWPSRDVTAGCFPTWKPGDAAHPEHEVPRRDCSCGLYAYHRPIRRCRIEGEAWGAVVAWGKIQVHAQGFRARHQRIVALAGETYDLHAIAARYGVALVDGDDLEHFAAQFASPIPVSLRPEPTPYPLHHRPVPAPSSAWVRALKRIRRVL